MTPSNPVKGIRLRVHHPVFAGFLGVLALLAVLTVVLVAAGLRTELGTLYREALERELNLAAALLVTHSEAGEALAGDSIAGELGTLIGFRVTLIGIDGAVLGDSDVPEESLRGIENHRDRPEVQVALGGDIGFAERRSGTVGADLLYAARTVPLREGEVVLRLSAPLAEIDRAVRRGQRAVAVAEFFGLLLSLFVAYLVSRVLTRPLGELASTAERLSAESGSAGPAPPAPGRARIGEIAEISTAFDRLTGQLHSRLSELGRERDEMQAVIDSMAEGVLAVAEDGRVLRINRAGRALFGAPDTMPLDSVTALVTESGLLDLSGGLVAELDAQEFALHGRTLIVSSRPLDQGGSVVTFLDTTDLRQLERVRRDFVANASHELKTPLTSMRGYAETLLEDDPPDDLRRKFLTSIHSNSIRLQRLVDDLLDLSRLESGRWAAQTEPVDVAALGEAIWEEMGEKSARKNVSLSVEGSGSVEADPSALAQIFQNLFDNSIRHVGEGGRIELNISRGPEITEIAVSDDGAGIPPEDLGRIFERFYRADPARSRAEGGTGLGLSIVRHLTSAMGGEVRAESEVGAGTTIRFTLPSAG